MVVDNEQCVKMSPSENHSVWLIFVIYSICFNNIDSHNLTEGSRDQDHAHLEVNQVTGLRTHNLLFE